MTPRVLATLPLRSEGDVVVARLHARSLAEQLGLDRQGQTRIATALSEIARNAFTHGGGGDVEFAVKPGVHPEHLCVRVADRGPGIADLQAILTGQKPFAGGLGTGLLSARRLVDQFHVETSAAGTRVLLSQRLPLGAVARLDAAALEAVAARPPRRFADPMAAVHEQNRELIESLNDLNERHAETVRLNRELEETNRGVVALYSELDERAEQLRHASELKSRFLSHMSHEFRTPLNSILALARLLLDGVDGELSTEQARQVDYIRRSAQGLLEMVNDLLDLAKVEAGKLEVKPVRFSIADLFTAMRGSLKPLLVNPAVDLVFDDPAGLPELVADESKVAQILRNLIANALKFTEAGRVHVSARHDAAAGRMVLAVADTGIGIAPESQRLIFEEFTQIDGHLQRGGTGLGLPLSRRLATLMGGDITVTSRPEEGSTFELVLPLRFGQPAAPGAHERPGPRRCVLVVDDEEAFRYVIRHIAHDAGLVVLEAGDGVAGLQLAQQHRPDLVILDLHLPRMDGFTLLARLAESGLAATPVIVCTSQSLTLEHRRALALARAIVPKHDLSRSGLTSLMHGLLPGAPGLPATHGAAAPAAGLGLQ
jgi:signal transduction histidine kinase/CheY-like chemotaxis protein